MNIAFQMDNPNNINFDGDTTFALIVEAISRNYTVYLYQPNDLSLLNSSVVSNGYKVIKADYSIESKLEIEVSKNISLSSMDIIWLRQDPPFNLSYISSTYLLDLLTKNVLILNNPSEVRNYPEKLIVQHFNKFIPPTLISRNKSLILDFLHKYKQSVIKPLYEGAGSNIFLLTNTDPNTSSIIDCFLHNYQEPFIVQKFLNKVVETGDKRVIIVNGKVEGVVARIPSQNEIKSNFAQGGIAAKAELTQRELEICNEVGPFLAEKNLFLAGLDLIDEHLTEINITSPTGIRHILQTSGIDLSPIIWDQAIKKYHSFKKSL